MTKLKHLRLERRWTQTELSKHSGVQVADISRIENGRIWPYQRWVSNLSSALEYNGDPYDLVEEHKPVNTKAE
jgi:transcriptional regulator with XRE-family HTH domain